MGRADKLGLEGAHQRNSVRHRRGGEEEVKRTVASRCLSVQCKCVVSVLLQRGTGTCTTRTCVGT